MILFFVCLPIMNNFNISQLKKRIMMMNKKRTSALFSAKYLLVLPLVCGLLTLNCMQINAMNKQVIAVSTDSLINQQKKQIDNSGQRNSKVYRSVDKMPMFPGGEKALWDFISENLEYPATALEKNIEGKVYVRFVVEDDGAINHITVLKGIHPDCDIEALRVVSSMPMWQPGRLDGKDVAVYYTLPIVFQIDKLEDEF